MIERLALGTVQFGSAYGVANTLGQPSQEDVTAIVARARAAGVDTLDTAVAYGDSELRLGQIGVDDWRVVTKLPPLPPEVQNIGDWVRQALADSLARLDTKSVYALLLHDSGNLAGSRGKQLSVALEREREKGLTHKIGVSIYDPSELDAIWPTFRPDVVQAPFNILDRRLEASGWLARLHADSVEVHARSVFLQGLLLIPDSERPKQFERWRPVWSRLLDWLATTGRSPVEACLGHTLSYQEISRVVVGVDSVAHLDAILAAARTPATRAVPSLASNDRDLINPSRWASL